MTYDSDDVHEAPQPEVVERYLSGECSLAEQKLVEAWMRADPTHRAHVESLRRLGEMWAAARPRFDSRAAWQRMQERTTREPTSTPRPTPAPVAASTSTVPRRPMVDRDIPFRTSSRRAVVSRWLATAAVVAAVLGGFTLRSRFQPVDAAAPAEQEYVTAAGQQIVLTLPDGTRIRLAPGSRLVVEAEYGRATRTVQLAGQAHFEVTHDDARPFRVRAGNTVAWDLGTKFTVRAYTGENLRVAVEEGSVAIPQALTAPLVAGDVAVIDSAGRGSVERGAELGRYTAWINGTLEFRDTPLDEVVADLSRWYGFDVTLGDAALARRHLTVAITELSIDAALELVAPAIGARYERHGRVVTLYPIETP